jgi:transcriptional regulator with XRE-family HTH domain
MAKTADPTTRDEPSGTSDVGRQLREVRRQQGLSRSEVARSAGLTRRELAAYERGRVPVPDSDLWCLAGSCGVDVGDLLPERPPLTTTSERNSLAVGDSIRRLRNLEAPAAWTPEALPALEAGSDDPYALLRAGDDGEPIPDFFSAPRAGDPFSPPPPLVEPTEPTGPPRGPIMLEPVADAADEPAAALVDPPVFDAEPAALSTDPFAARPAPGEPWDVAPPMPWAEASPAPDVDSIVVDDPLGPGGFAAPELIGEPIDAVALDAVGADTGELPIRVDPTEPEEVVLWNEDEPAPAEPAFADYVAFDEPVAEPYAPVAEPYAPVDEPFAAPAPVEPAVVEASFVDAPIDDAPIDYAPIADAPVADTPIDDTPVADTPIDDTLVYDAPVVEAPVLEPTPVAQPAPAFAPDDEFLPIAWAPQGDVATVVAPRTEPTPPRFVQAGADWRIGGIFPATAMADDGALALRRADARWALADVDAPGDFTVEATFDFTAGAGFGVLFRATVGEGERLNGYSFDVDPVAGGGGYLLRQWEDNRQHWRPLAQAPVADFARLYGRHTMSVTLAGDHLTVLVDGDTVLSIPALSHASIDLGRAPCRGAAVGVQAWATTEVTVDAFRVARV